MDWLVKYVTARTVFGLLALVAAGLLVGEFGHLGLAWYRDRNRVSYGGTTQAGQEILADVDRREAARVEGRFRRLQASLAQARADGFDVRDLEKTAEAAMALNNQQYRRRAVKILEDIELKIPRHRERFTASPSPASSEADAPEVVGAPALGSRKDPAR